MRKYALLVCLVMFFALLFSPAFATHLGPIIFGEERIESVTLCFAVKDAMALARLDEESVKKGESLEKFLNKTLHLAVEGKCDAKHLRYTPLETIYQWIGREKRADGTFGQTQMSLLKSQSGNTSVFVIVTDKAPPPSKKQKKL
ncbi:MAG: hypothetical protein Q8R40_06660 [bacterium]|nr:hypothetical protein [bacterium]